MIKCPDTDEAFEKALVLIHVLRPDFFFINKIAITNLWIIKLKHIFKKFSR